MRLIKALILFYMRLRLNTLAVFSKKKAAKAVFEILCTPQSRTVKKEPAIFAKAEKHHIEHEGLILNGYRWNHPSGKKILIVHGFESTALNFEKCISLLLKKNFEIVAFDAPAHGKSEGNKLTLPLFVSVIRSVNTSFGPFDAYIAHSFGGLAVTHFLEQAPSSSFLKIALIAPLTELTTTIDKLFQFLGLGKAVREELDHFIAENRHHEPGWYSIKRAIHNINAEIFWCHDKDDDMTPFRDVQPLILEAPAHIRFHITSGLGHRRIYRDNEVLKKIVEFIG